MIGESKRKNQSTPEWASPSFQSILGRLLKTGRIILWGNFGKQSFGVTMTSWANLIGQTPNRVHSTALLLRQKDTVNRTGNVIDHNRVAPSLSDLHYQHAFSFRISRPIQLISISRLLLPEISGWFVARYRFLRCNVNGWFLHQCGRGFTNYVTFYVVVWELRNDS